MQGHKRVAPSASGLCCCSNPAAHIFHQYGLEVVLTTKKVHHLTMCRWGSVMCPWQPLARTACSQKVPVTLVMYSLQLQAGRDKAKPLSTTFLGLQAVLSRGNIRCKSASFPVPVDWPLPAGWWGLSMLPRA